MRRRYLLEILATAYKWLANKFSNIYYSIIPATLSNKTVKDKCRIAVIEGNSEVENQLVKEYNFNTHIYWQLYNSNYTSVSYSSNKATITINTSPSYSYETGFKQINLGIKANHKYLVRVIVKPSANVEFVFEMNSTTRARKQATANIENIIEDIITLPSSITEDSILLFPNAVTQGLSYEISFVNVVDLTKDYPFDTPTSLTDNRVQNIIRQGFKPQNTGSINNSVISEIETRGFNIWDEQWERGSFNLSTGEKTDYANNFRSKNRIKVVPNANYYIKTPYQAFVLFYDINGNYIDYHGTQIYGYQFTTPNNCAYITFTVGAGGADYNHDICINRSSSLNGTYLPHIPSQYLPIEYQEVEYLESHGTEYIDTGAYLTANFKIKYKVNVTSLNQIGIIWGSYVSGNRYDTQVRNTAPNVWEVQRGSSSTYVDDFDINTDFEITETQSKFIANGVESSVSGSFSQNNEKVGLFSNLAGSLYPYPSICKIYYFKLYDNNTLVRNFIPCYRKSDNVAGLYDLVNNKFYTNSGTGTFSVGKAVNNNTIIKLPAPLELAGVNDKHNTFEITDNGYVFTKTMALCDLSGVTFAQYGSAPNYLFYGNVPNGRTSVGQGNVVTLLCSKYACNTVAQGGGSTASGTDKLATWDASNSQILIKDTSYADATAFNNSTSGLTLLYELKNPQTITIPKKHLGWVDLGSLNWTYWNSTYGFYSTDLNSLIKLSGYSNGSIFPLVCSKYIRVIFASVATENKVISFYKSDATRLVIKDTTYTDATTFKNAMKGVWLFYETEDEVADFLNEASCQAGGEINGQCARVPNAYQEVEYIESDGNQRIDTGLIPSASQHYEFELQLLDLTASRYILGQYSASVQYYLYISSGSKLQVGWSFNYLDTITLDTNKHKYDIYSDNSNVYVKQDGASVTTQTKISMTASRDLTLFKGVSSGSYTSWNAPQRLFSFKVSENNTLIRNFIPCYRKSDQVIGLYDTVSGQFFTNQGTGTFLKGGNVDSPTCEVLPNVEMKFKCK